MAILEVEKAGLYPSYRYFLEEVTVEDRTRGVLTISTPYGNETLLLYDEELSALANPSINNNEVREELQREIGLLEDHYQIVNVRNNSKQKKTGEIEPNDSASQRLFNMDPNANDFIPLITEAMRGDLLSAWEEVSLSRISKLQLDEDSRKKAYDKLITSNMRLIIRQVKKYMNRGVEFDDLFQEGVIGLMTAARKFDSRKGSKFSTYAVWWINQNLGRSIEEQSRAIRLPSSISASVNKIKFAVNRLSAEQPYLTTNEQVKILSLQLGMHEDQITKLLALLDLECVTSLNQRVRDGEETEIGSLIPSSDDTATEAIENIDKQILIDAIITAMKALSPYQRDIVTYHYGINTDVHSMAEIGRLLAKANGKPRSREAIRQQVVVIEALLKESLENYRTSIGEE